MPKKNEDGFIKIEDIKKKLGYAKALKISKEDLLKDALQKGLISKKEFDASLPIRNSVLKCYLYSLIDNDIYREKIEEYVKQYSMLYIRGTYIANLVTKNIYGSINTSKEYNKIDINSFNEESETLYKFIEDKNTFKQIFLPERWPTKTIELNEKIENIMLEFGDRLIHLLPNYSSLMPNTGWDNSLNMMYTRYRANIENHIIVHLIDNVCKYLKKVTETENKKIIINLFKKKPIPYIMSNEDYEHIMNLRMFLGTIGNEYLKSDFEYNKTILDFHMKIIKSGTTKSIYLPIASIGRKYAYLDTKISQNLFKVRNKTMIEILNLSIANIYKKRKEKRKMIRQKEHKKRIENKKYNLKKINHGYLGIPKMSNITCIETDGVGLSIILSTKYTEKGETYETEKEYKKEESFENPVFAAIDFGRAKIFTASISSNPLKKPISYSFTRGRFYYDIKHNIRKNINEKNIIDKPDLKDALEQLALDNGKKNIESYITKVSNYSIILLNEYLISKEYALWRMRLFRLSKQSKDLAVRRFIEKAGKNRPLIIGIGDAGFPSSGKGEKSVPTTGMLRSFIKSKFIHHQPIKIISINEFKTSQCCSSCGFQTVPKPVSNTQRRKVYCNSCHSFKVEFVNFEDTSTVHLNCFNNNCDNQITLKKFPGSIRLKKCNSVFCNGRCYDRDVMASRNMLWCLQGLHYGFERPEPLCRIARE